MIRIADLTVRRGQPASPSESQRLSVSHPLVGEVGYVIHRQRAWYAQSLGGELTGPARTRRAYTLGDLARWLEGTDR